MRRSNGRSAVSRCRGRSVSIMRGAISPISRSDPSRSCPRRSSSRRSRASTVTATSRRAAAIAYDVFGNGKTSLKMNVGKYLEAATNHNTYSFSNPAARIAGSPVLGAPPPVTRAWTDSNNNYKPDCDLLNPNAQNLSASGGDVCGVLSNTELRQADLQRKLRSRDPRGLGCSSERLADRRLHSAGADDGSFC